MISFTGSVRVGKQLMAAGARTLTRVGLELGGNNPFLVFDDADMEQAAQAAVIAKLRNGGQTCVCANRILVHEAVATEFTRLFSAAMHDKVVGPGMDASTDIGPLVVPGAARRIQHAIDEAVRAGASIVCGGRPLDRPVFPRARSTRPPSSRASPRVQGSSPRRPSAPLPLSKHFVISMRPSRQPTPLNTA